ncbi:MAG: PA0069 family radical SAM protein [Gemmatimonadales bacterium]|nr:MAG: PA0069 family radical SAM protein [Gemmatimonadales bacterium]
MKLPLASLSGRGAGSDPPNRFEELALELDAEEADGEPGRRETLYFRDPARSVLTRNRSPDVGFDWSLNPYRGCTHGCSYCYARPTHEYLGLSAGLDFESRIFVKEDAPRLLRDGLASPRWAPVPLVLSGVTDPYQSVERRLEITRGCLAVLEETGHPVAVITKSRLVCRDTDLLASLAARGAAHVTLSITTLDRRLQRALEPRASPPEHRLDAIRTLSDAGVPVAVNVAPVIPGLTEHEIPAILDAAAKAGASAAGMVLLRLPWGVKEIFEDWLRRHLPDRADKVLNRLRDAHGGKLYDASPGHRMRGSGPHADQIRSLFMVSARKAGLDRRALSLSTDAFRPPPATRKPSLQLDLPLG